MKRNFLLLGVSTICLIFVLAGPVQAATLVFNIALDPGQEIPTPTIPDGFNPSGTATVTVDTVTRRVSVNGTYTGMTAGVFASHIHGPAGPTDLASPLITLSNTGGTDGTFSLTERELSELTTQRILSGQTYINIHTTGVNSTGEIRGQIVPEPGTLVATTLLALPWLVSRRRRT